MAMNTSKIVVGGFAAGVVMTVFEGLGHGVLLGPRMKAEMDAAAPGLHEKMMTGGTITIAVVSQFVIGLLVVWLYAAMRPRLGPGMKTAVYAALVLWICGFVNNEGWYLSGIMTATTYVYAMLMFLIALVASASVGGMLYKEETAQITT